MLTVKVVTPKEVLLRDIDPKIAEAIIATISDLILASDYDIDTYTADAVCFTDTMSIRVTMKGIFDRLEQSGHSRPNNYMKYLEVITRPDGPFHKAGWKVRRLWRGEDTYFVFTDTRAYVRD